jgi:ribosomal protein S18 acetylase RimI-like enzyme
VTGERVEAVTVDEVYVLDDGVVKALERLLPQLSSSAATPSRAEVAEMVDSPATVLLVARRGGDAEVVGSLTLAVFRIPTGRRAWIEDVVVDTAARGQGIGSALVRAAIDRAAQMGCRSVDLTSRPDREDANRLYESLGFTRRQTNVYRYSLEASPPPAPR